MTFANREAPIIRTKPILMRRTMKATIYAGKKYHASVLGMTRATYIKEVQSLIKVIVDSIVKLHIASPLMLTETIEAINKLENTNKERLNARKLRTSKTKKKKILR
jgi:hypothetical protein